MHLWGQAVVLARLAATGSCVTHAKQACGLNSVRIQTPYQLYRALKPLADEFWPPDSLRERAARRFVLFCSASDELARRWFRPGFQHAAVVDYFPPEGTSVVVERTGLYWNTSLFEATPTSAADEYCSLLGAHPFELCPVPSYLYGGDRQERARTIIKAL